MAKKSKHINHFTAQHLEPGEQVVATCLAYLSGQMGGDHENARRGAIIVTTTRVVYYRKGLMSESLESIPLSAITSIERKTGLVNRRTRIHTSHDAMSYRSIDDKAVEQRVYDAIQAGRDKAKAAASAVTPAAAPQPAPAAAAADTLDQLDQLQRLGALRESGVLTEAEFLVQKKKLLGTR